MHHERPEKFKINTEKTNKLTQSHHATAPADLAFGMNRGTKDLTEYIVIGVAFLSFTLMNVTAGKAKWSAWVCCLLLQLVYNMPVAGASIVPEDLDNVAWQKYLSHILKQSKYSILQLRHCSSKATWQQALKVSTSPA